MDVSMLNKRKKRRDTDLIVLIICGLVFILIIYFLFFARIGKKPRPAVEQPPQTTSSSIPPAETPVAQKTEKAAGTDTKESPAEPQKSAPSAQADQPAVAVDMKMYNKRPFEKETLEFFPSEKIYVSVTFPKLASGKFEVTANWLDPTGRKINSANRIIEQSRPSAQRIYFWLELMKNGGFTEMFTGKEYKASVYGTWEVEILFNSQRLKTQKFTIHE